jgi:hypothetical protein
MLRLEPLLRARLASIPELRGVWGLADLQADKTKPTPCAYVVFDGARSSEGSGDHRQARMTTQWVVVLVVAHKGDATDGERVRAEANRLADGLLQRLMGWTPDTVHRPLRLVEASPDYEAGGVMWLTLRFETSLILSGTGA